MRRSRAAPKDAPRAAPACFIRTGTDAQLTDLGCPDCRGVLSVDARGPAHYLAFRCRVGHAFSLESLLPVKEDQLEESLWSAIEVCEELASLYSYLAEHAARTGTAALATEHRGAMKRTLAQSRALRELLGAGPSPLSKTARRP
jgi:two-component system, chemotaxis family, protein-glutamate methylesterase/glutaminase